MEHNLTPCLTETLLLPDCQRNDNDDNNGIASSAPATPSSPSDEDHYNDDDDHHSASASVVAEFDQLLKRSKATIRKTMALTFFAVCGRAIWSPTVLPIWIVLVWPHHHQLEWVGYTTAVMGFSQAGASLLTQIILKQGNYEKPILKILLKVASLVGLVALGISLCGLLFFWKDENPNLSFLLAAIASFGILWGISDPVLPLVFEEAVEWEGNKQEGWYKRCSNVMRAANCSGTLITFICFGMVGNKWTIEACSLALMIGMGFTLPVVGLLWSLRIIGFRLDGDDEENYEHQASLEVNNAAEEDQVSNNGGNHDDFYDYFHFDRKDCSFLGLEEDGGPNADVGSQLHGTNQHQELDSDSVIMYCVSTKKLYIPILVNLADCLSSFASGLSIRYFPVFFARQLHLSPVCVQFLYLAVPLGQWISPLITKRLTRIIGPCRASIALQWLFVLSMASMVGSYWRSLPWWVFCMLFCVHGSLTNSTSALSKSLVYNNAPVGGEDADRYYWWWSGATGRIQMLLWSTGAAVGGYGAGRWGIISLFMVTVAMQLSATLPWLVLLLVNPSIDDYEESEDENEENGRQSGSVNDLPFIDCVGDEKSRPTDGLDHQSGLLDSQGGLCSSPENTCGTSMISTSTTTLDEVGQRSNPNTNMMSQEDNINESRDSSLSSNSSFIV